MKVVSGDYASLGFEFPAVQVPRISPSSASANGIAFWAEFGTGFFLFENWLFGVLENFVLVLQQPSLIWTNSAEIDVPDFAV